MKIWIVAYEQPAEPEIMVSVRYTRREAERLAKKVDRELVEWGYSTSTTSITEYEIDTGASK